MQVSLNHSQVGYLGASGSMNGLSHPEPNYAAPDVSGFLNPDIDLPLDFGAFDDFPVADNLHVFVNPHSAAPMATTHTHHYPPQQPQFQQHQQEQPPMQLPHGHGTECNMDEWGGDLT